ncbi:hypothetical protein Barb7_03044 [Bacteroidales bacterium Barb7]|nr:hypothetical protein Barb7_03044 [Bacteroidales bacterium Barb7]
MTENFDIFEVGDSDFSLDLPVKGDKLTKDSDIGNHAIINERQFATPVFIIIGYYQNAKSIVWNLCNENSYLQKNTMIYPALNSFRQYYIELTRKDSIRRFKLAEGLDYSKAGHAKTHSLVDLWKELVEFIKDSNPNPNDTTLLAIENLIIEFNQLDEGSYNFRYYYDINREGNIELLFKGRKVVEIENLYLTMCKMHNFLMAYLN